MKKVLFAALAVTVAVMIWKDPLRVGRGGPNADAASLGGTSFTVVNSGATAWNIDGSLNPPLTLNQGQTYVFNVTATGHPFYIRTARVTGSGSQYTPGTNGQGVTNGQLTFDVPLDAPGTLFYQCGVHSSMGGTFTILGPLDVEGTIPRVAWLGRAIPNPARNGASFRFGLPRDARIDFAVFDTRGRRVRDLSNGPMTAGEHSLQWDGRDKTQRAMPSGFYFYRLRVEGRQLSGRLLVTR